MIPRKLSIKTGNFSIDLHNMKVIRASGIPFVDYSPTITSVDETVWKIILLSMMDFKINVTPEELRNRYYLELLAK